MTANRLFVPDHTHLQAIAAELSTKDKRIAELEAELNRQADRFRELGCKQAELEQELSKAKADRDGCAESDRMMQERLARLTRANLELVEENTRAHVRGGQRIAELVMFRRDHEAMEALRSMVDYGVTDVAASLVRSLEWTCKAECNGTLRTEEASASDPADAILQVAERLKQDDRAAADTDAESPRPIPSDVATAELQRYARILFDYAPSGPWRTGDWSKFESALLGTLASGAFPARGDVERIVDERIAAFERKLLAAMSAEAKDWDEASEKVLDVQGYLHDLLKMLVERLSNPPEAPESKEQP